MEPTTEESQKKLLASILKERLIESKNTINYKELLEQDIPKFLKNFLQNRVQKLFYTNEPFQFKNSKRYDFNYERIRKLKEQLNEAFIEATLFTKEEITEIINRTVALQFDLLIAPKETLNKILYRNKSERTQKEILKILMEIIESRVFIEKLIENIRASDHYHIIQDDFNKILNQTENDVYSNDFLHAFISEVNAYLRFVNHTKGTQEKAISVEIVKLLLKERSLNGYCNVFDSINITDDWIEIQELTAKLNEFIDQKDVVAKEYYAGEADEDIEEFIVPLIGTENEEQESDQELLIDTDETEINDTRIEIQKHHPEIVECLEPKDFIIDREMIEYQPDGPLPSLILSIDEKSKRMIQRKIFKKDELAYTKFIKKLENINNWKDAKQVIDEELELRAIPPFCREALRLGDLVFSRYFPEKD